MDVKDDPCRAPSTDRLARKGSTDLYAKEGSCSAIAKHWCFQYISMLIVLLNTVWLAYDVDANNADNILDAKVTFQIVEYMFCALFVIEICIRFFAFER